MNNINWDKLPDELTMEQFYKLCHVSKKTARYLLRSGKIPWHVQTLKNFPGWDQCRTLLNDEGGAV